MKRVLLVNTNTERAPYPVPPLGLCMLGAELEKHYHVKVYDGIFDEGERLITEIKAFSPDYVGFSIRNIDDVVADRTIFYPDIILKNFIRPSQSASGAVQILGGSGFSIFPREMMQLTDADYGIAGEGEGVLLKLLQTLDSGGDPSLIPNLWIGNRQVPSHGNNDNPSFYQQISFAEMDRWIDFNPYRQRGVYSIQTKRGCALGCIYCTYPRIEGRQYRLREPGQIVREMREISERLGDVMFEFVDSTFNEPAGHAEAICEAIIREGLRIRIRTMGINPHNTSERLFRLMKEAGFTQIDATPDSASPTIIRNLGKGFTLKDIRRTAKLIGETDMPTMWFFLFGGPGENEVTVRETLSFINDYIGPDDLVYLTAGLRVYPGTPLQQIAIREGLIQKDDPLFNPSVFYFSPQLPRERLSEMMAEAAATFPNCIPAAQTTPPQPMVEEAIKMRLAKNLTEPMFRSLLRVRREWMQAGKL